MHMSHALLVVSQRKNTHSLRSACDATTFRAYHMIKLDDAQDQFYLFSTKLFAWLCVYTSPRAHVKPTRLLLCNVASEASVDGGGARCTFFDSSKTCSTLLRGAVSIQGRAAHIRRVELFLFAADPRPTDYAIN